MKQEVLFLSHRMPFPPDRGEKIRAHHVLKRIAALAPVHVATFADDESDMVEEVELAAMARSYRLVRRVKPLIVAGLQGLQQRKPVLFPAYSNPEIAAYVVQVLEQRPITTIYVSSVQMGQYVPASFKGRVIADLVDVESARFEAIAQRHHGLQRRLEGREARLLQVEEQRFARRANVSLFASPEEATLFNQRLAPESRASCDLRVMRNGTNTDHFDPAKVPPDPQLSTWPKPRLIFTGRLDNTPNIEAVRRAVLNIMPLIRKDLPDASYHVVGSRPAPEISVLDGVNGCRVWAGVEDVRSLLAAADLALVAMSIGRGVQNKVLEAMAMALPVVASPEGVMGIDGIDGVHFATADSDAGLAKRAVALLTHPRLGWSTGLEARRFVSERLGWAGALAPVSELIGQSVPADAMIVADAPICEAGHRSAA